MHEENKATFGKIEMKVYLKITRMLTLCQHVGHVKKKSVSFLEVKTTMKTIVFTVSELFKLSKKQHNCKILFEVSSL